MTELKIGDIIKFGEYHWLVLDVQEDKALIITEDVVEEREYHDENVDITWENCTLRKYLNGEFLGKFDVERVVPTNNKNRHNLWHINIGGEDTVDSVFLLSFDDAITYFNENIDRQAKFNGEHCCWWLRTQKNYESKAIFITWGGSTAGGECVDVPVGVRPALWLKLCGGNENVD